MTQKLKCIILFLYPHPACRRRRWEFRLSYTTVDLPLNAHIPEEYVTDLETRLELYQKISKLTKVEEIETLAQEFNDRFGALPAEVENLLYAVKIKLLAAKAGIDSVSTEHGQIVIRRFEGLQFDKQKLEPLLREGVKVGVTRITLNPKRLGKEWREVVVEVVKRCG